MPDPRQRQHNPQPPRPSTSQRGQAPAKPAGPEAAPRGSSRPVRSLDPSQQAPPVEAERKIRKGEAYWIMGSEELPRPRKGTIIRLSSEPGKAVGVEFEEPLGGVDENGQSWGTIHTCDGRGKNGYCLYVRPDQVLDEKAMKAHSARQAEAVEASKFDEYEELLVGPKHTQPLTPAIAGPESDKDEGEDKDEDKDEEKDE